MDMAFATRRSGVRDPAVHHNPFSDLQIDRCTDLGGFAAGPACNVRSALKLTRRFCQAAGARLIKQGLPRGNAEEERLDQRPHPPRANESDASPSHGGSTPAS